MTESNIVDTFPAFLSFWEKAKDQSIDAQIAGWADSYLAKWPELLNKQIQNYSEQGYDWHMIARERVVPFWRERLPLMRRAHKNLLDICAPTYKRAQETLCFEQTLTYLLYVGIGCGAGWATIYQNNPAILLGLENIAEEGWEDPSVLKGLIGHEMGHLWHFAQRTQAGLQMDKGPWWDLYTEGLAQRCESIIAGEGSWHMADTKGDWLKWCRQEKCWLAREFLKVTKESGDVRAFFGSWFDIRGYKETGYYLGYEAIRRLEVYKTLQEIALLEDVEAIFYDIVKGIAADVT